MKKLIKLATIAVLVSTVTSNLSAQSDGHVQVAVTESRPESAVALIGATLNGDYDASGTVDVNDVIGFLGWMFLGGHDPVPFNCPVDTIEAESITRDESFEVVADAQDALESMPSLKAIYAYEDESLRQIALESYSVVQNLARTNPEDLEAVTLNFDVVEARLAIIESSREAGTCTFSCLEDRDDCLARCKNSGRRFCGCHAAAMSCIVLECTNLPNESIGVVLSNG